MTADCPYCDEWRFSLTAEAVYVRPVGGSTWQAIWDGERLLLPRGSDPIDVQGAATAAHVCMAHPLEPEVLLFGPVEEWRPLMEFDLHPAVFGRLRA